MKKENKNLIISIVAVSLIIVLAGGATYAWYTWVSGNNTAVNITVAGITYTLDGGGNITSSKNLAPTDECNHATYAIKRTITAKVANSTEIAAKAYVQINPSSLPSAFQIANLEWVLTTSSTSCTSNIVSSGNFASATQGTKFDLTSFDVPALSTVNKTYYLYIWVNKDYSVQNVGGSVTSSIQDKTFTLKIAGEVTNDPDAFYSGNNPPQT